MEYKGKQLKIEDTNIAYLGSELEKKVKLAAAETEEAWKDVGKEPGLNIWRIEQFKVVPWPKEQYGSFYSGDSYIILHTYKKENNADKLYWHAHMWVGNYTTMDEAGTAAYKIVELDDLFNREIVLFREVQGEESPLFLSYFKVITIMDGGVDSGFKKVPVDEYKPRLLHVKGKTHFRVLEVPLKLESLTSGDTYLLDSGLVIYNWRGSKSNHFEKFKGLSVAQSISSERNGKSKIITLEEGDDDENFWKLLGGKGEIKADCGIKDEDIGKNNKIMFQLSDSTGELNLKEVEFKKDSLQSEDVFLIDAGSQIFIWVGKNCSSNEKKNSLGIAQQYLKDNNRPNISFSCIPEGRETVTFEEIIA